MLVENVMKRQVITINPLTTITEAMILTEQNRIRHLPVLDGDKLVGIITDRKLKEACPYKIKGEADLDQLKMPVERIMTKDVLTTHPLDYIEDAAKVMYDHKISSLPVLQNNHLVGIITESDILRTLIELMGVTNPSSRIEVEVEDKPGMLADIANIFKDKQVNVNSVLLYPGTRPNKKTIVFRIQTLNYLPITSSLKKAGYQIKWPIIPEESENE